MEQNDISSTRLISLDALRGFTIAAMVIVNNPGSWGSVYTPLLHAEWHGITVTDLIFPFFLFMVGVSVTLAYTKRKAAGTPKNAMYKKIVSRTLKIFLLGLFLWLWPNFEFGELRYAGVLQRIAVVFLVCAVLFLNTNWKQQLFTAAILLLGYWLLLAFVPVPVDEVIRQAIATGTVERSGGQIVKLEGIQQLTERFIAPNYQPGVNFAAWFDRLVLPGKFWERTWDPEGLFSTFPAIATGITGMLMGSIIINVKESYQKLTWLFFAGFSMFITGEVWSWFFPLNKNLWSSSFVLVTSGLATMGLGACILLVDMLGYKKWTKLGRVYGANAITSYVLAGMLTLVFYRDIFGGNALNQLFMSGMTGIGIPAKLASLMNAVLYMLIIYIPAYVMYKKRIFIKV